MNAAANYPRWSRRQALAGALALGFTPAVARATPVILSPETVNGALLARAQAALDRHAAVIRNRDRVALVDFSRPSRDQRMTIVNIASGQGLSFLVAHGRGSDPMHSGWVEQFSNAHGSLASSNGAYVTAARYSGVHGDAQRLIGLDPENDNAEARAIVIHGADYVSDAIIASQGKLGRSEGCFALRRDDVAMALALLGEGTLIYADRT